MKQTTEKDKLLFTFSLTQKEFLEQIEFLYGYYVAKLKQLRRRNSYVRKFRAAEELLYKDLIAACACYIQETLTNPMTDEGYNQESRDLS